MNYSNKKLSDVPLKEIELGMVVVGPYGGEGKVVTKTGTGLIRINWDNGEYLYSKLHLTDEVKVK